MINSNKRLWAEERARQALRGVPLDELQQRRKRARTHFAKRMLKEAERAIQHPALHKSLHEFAMFCQQRRIKAGEDLHKATETQRAYYGSDATVTRRLHRKLESLGHEGQIAAHLLRAQKASSRAKGYGRSRHRGFRVTYSDLSYARKGDSITALCELLSKESCGLRWGWARDPANPKVEWLLYVDLPVGQVSFHSPARGTGPDYAAGWDGAQTSEERIIAYCDSLLEQGPAASTQA